jgi:hypothetical protein
MNLPPIDNRPGEWSPTVIDGWVRLVEKTNRMKAKVGGSDAFERVLMRFRDMATSGRFDGLRELLGQRLGARALTWLWLHDEVIGSRLLNMRLLDALIENQQPRLSRLTLIQLIQLYFRHFDRLDERDKQAEVSLRGRLERHLLDQLKRLEERSQTFVTDPLGTLKREGQWLLTLDGPLTLAKSVHEQGSELAQTFETFGLSGFDVGRYGDVCRAHFYLDVLRQLRPGEWDDVLDELLKPAVSKAPYEGDKCIGHAALEIMIDRAGDEPGDAWQNFILSLAGDPRIASSTPRFREWWKPLGESRISKVRGWLSKEDLRLFLQAVEQYGVESGNAELKRMFPARKLFLEGMFKLGLIRHTRLMLGRVAQQSVKRILGGEVKTNFAHMEGSMSDKAVIYLDCGDFHLVEGSHSFKIWVYLAQPGPKVKSYESNHFTHFDLTTELPRQYQQAYPTLPYAAVTHNGQWQRKVFEFLAENGIGLDIEQLLSRQEYKSYLNRYGIPVVGQKRAPIVPSPQIMPKPAATPQRDQLFSMAAQTVPVKPVAKKVLLRSSPSPLKDGITAEELTDVQLAILEFLSAHPQSLLGDIFRGLSSKDVPVYEIKACIEGPLAEHVFRDVIARWALSSKGAALVSGRSPIQSGSIEADLLRLSPVELQVLRYFASNPHDKVRYAANVLEVDARDINKVLYGRLKALCQQGDGFGWTVRADVTAALELIDK